MQQTNGRNIQKTKQAGRTGRRVPRTQVVTARIAQVIPEQQHETRTQKQTPAGGRKRRLCSGERNERSRVGKNEKRRQNRRQETAGTYMATQKTQAGNAETKIPVERMVTVKCRTQNAGRHPRTVETVHLYSRIYNVENNAEREEITKM